MNKNCFIKNTEGAYTLQGAITGDEIIAKAGELLYQQLASKTQLTSSKETGRFFQHKLGNSKNEKFAVIFLDAQHRVIAYEEMFNGTIDAAAVYPRIVLQRALELNASALIMAHCHPSGSHENSSHADRQITKRLIETLALIDVRVLDHIIVSASGYSSMAEKGEM